MTGNIMYMLRIVKKYENFWLYGIRTFQIHHVLPPVNKLLVIYTLLQ